MNSSFQWPQMIRHIYNYMWNYLISHGNVNVWILSAPLVISLASQVWEAQTKIIKKSSSFLWFTELRWCMFDQISFWLLLIIKVFMTTENIFKEVQKKKANHNTFRFQCSLIDDHQAVSLLQWICSSSSYQLDLKRQTNIVYCAEKKT